MRLSSCYFCGAALDAPVDAYRVVPDELATDDDRTVTLCPTCRRKLATVVDAVVEAADAPAATTLSDYGDDVTTDDGNGGVEPRYDPGVPAPEKADAETEGDEVSAVTPPESGDGRSGERDTSGADGRDPGAARATDEADTGDGAAESETEPDAEERSGAVSPDPGGDDASISPDAPEGDDASDRAGGAAEATDDGSEATEETGEQVDETGDTADYAVGPAGDATDPVDSSGEQAADEGELAGGAADRPGDAANGNGEGAETPGGANPVGTDREVTPDSAEGENGTNGSTPAGAQETEGMDRDGEENADSDTDQGSEMGETADDERPSILSTPTAKKVVRLLQNREFPVDREEFQVVVANAYDLSREDCEAVVDALVEGGYVAVENDMLVRPTE